MKVLHGHDEAVNALALSPDGQILASASSDRSIRLWNLKTGWLRQVLDDRAINDGDLVFTPDGKLLVAASRDGSIKLWDLSSGNLHVRLDGHTSRITDLAISSDGKILASASHDRTIRLWNLPSGSLIRVLSHSGAVHEVAFAPAGQRLASALTDGTILIWNLLKPDLSTLFVTMPDEPGDLAWSPDGQALAVASGRSIFIFDSETSTIGAQLSGHADQIRSITFSADGTTLASASSDRTIRIWDPRIREMPGISLPPRLVQSWQDVSLLNQAPEGLASRVNFFFGYLFEDVAKPAQRYELGAVNNVPFPQLHPYHELTIPRPSDETLLYRIRRISDE